MRAPFLLPQANPMPAIRQRKLAAYSEHVTGKKTGTTSLSWGNPSSTQRRR
jgi:hypothetical protein